MRTGREGRSCGGAGGAGAGMGLLRWSSAERVSERSGLISDAVNSRGGRGGSGAGPAASETRHVRLQSSRLGGCSATPRLLLPQESGNVFCSLSSSVPDPFTIK